MRHGGRAQALAGACGLNGTYAQAPSVPNSQPWNLHASPPSRVRLPSARETDRCGQRSSSTAARPALSRHTTSASPATTTRRGLARTSLLGSTGVHWSAKSANMTRA